jgi:hypothetical protein
LEEIDVDGISQFGRVEECIVSDSDALYGMRILPTQICVVRELETVLQMTGKSGVHSLSCTVGAFEEFMRREQISRPQIGTNHVDDFC